MSDNKNDQKWIAVQFNELWLKPGEEATVLFEAFNAADLAKHHARDLTPKGSLRLNVEQIFNIAKGEAPAEHVGITPEMAKSVLEMMAERAQQYGPGGSHEHLSRKMAAQDAVWGPSAETFRALVNKLG